MRNECTADTEHYGHSIIIIIFINVASIDHSTSGPHILTDAGRLLIVLKAKLGRGAKSQIRIAVRSSCKVRSIGM